MRRLLIALLFLTGLAFVPSAPPLLAQDKAPQASAALTEVDVALVLAVDISYSMDLEELALQRNGYIQALKSPEVAKAIDRGLIGKIAVMYFEWAGANVQHVVVPWTIIDGPQAASAFAEKLVEAPTRRGRKTSIAAAIDASVAFIEQAPVRAMKKVIDVSGDGPNNDGRFVTQSRDDALAKGIGINGLPLTLKPSGYLDIDNLDRYYKDCVIGGPGAFLIPVKDPGNFIEAVRNKLVLEISRVPQDIAPTVLFAQTQGTTRPTDCMIGERQWRERWGN
jgi:Protein of unknown function (DUF1194)